jgi:glycosyltransferase involved in cell wall biosynthesis
MNYLFVHQNFPGQYLHLAQHLSAIQGNRVVSITQRKDAHLPGIQKALYQPPRDVTPGLHHYLRGTEAGVLNAQAVARVALNLKREGFVPDVMLGHNGWGEIWYLKDVFPHTPLVGYFEFFYRLRGADVGFDPGDVPTFDTGPRIRSRNLGNLLGLDSCDFGQCPTEWQCSRYPERYRSMLRVMHEGIDTDLARPDPAAGLTIYGSGTNEGAKGERQGPPAGGASDPIELKAGDEIVTYVARNLEPYRGFPSFMRSLPTILKAQPKARILIVGGDEVSYGTRLANDETYRQQLLAELGDSLDRSRVHFLGRVPYPTLIKLFQISSAHVYLTYPFVLSWSMLEAMSCECLIIGSRTPPVEEVIRDGGNGILIDFFNPDEIAQKVISALAEPKAFATLRKNARQTIVEKYDLKRVCLPGQLKMLEEVRGQSRGTRAS